MEYLEYLTFAYYRFYKFNELKTKQVFIKIKSGFLVIYCSYDFSET
jgi:hypothetical protein